MVPNLLKAKMTDSNRLRNTVELITRRLSLVRALYIVSIAMPGSPDSIKEEFHRAVGDVLEGKTLADLKLSHINKEKVRHEVTWLQEHL